MAYRTSDSKKEEFRKYLEKQGVVDAITKVLVRLYEEPDKPSDPLDFMKNLLGGASDESSKTDKVKALQDELDAVKQENADLKAKLAALEGKSDEVKE